MKLESLLRIEPGHFEGATPKGKGCEREQRTHSCCNTGILIEYVGGTSGNAGQGD